MNTEAILAKGAEVFEVLKGKWIMNLKLATREGQSVDKRLEYEDKALEIFHVMERMGNAPYVLKQYQNSLGGNLNPLQKFNRQLKILKRNKYSAKNKGFIKDVNILREYIEGKRSLGKNENQRDYNSRKQEKLPKDSCLVKRQKNSQKNSQKAYKSKAYKSKAHKSKAYKSRHYNRRFQG